MCQNILFWLDLSVGSALERLLLKNEAECTSQRLKWTSGARFMIIFGRSVPRSLGRSLGCSVARSVARSVVRSVARSLGRSLGRSVARSVVRSVARSLDRSIAPSIARSVARSLGRSLDRSLDKFNFHFCNRDWDSTYQQTRSSHMVGGLAFSNLIEGGTVDEQLCPFD